MVSGELLHAMALPEPLSMSISGAIPSGFTIRHTVPEVHLQFTVFDEHGRLHTDLSGSDFRVFDSRSAVVNIRKFTRLDNLPLETAILVDVSDSVQKAVVHERQVVDSFLGQVFRPQSDRASISTFSNAVQVRQGPTSDLGALQVALQQVQAHGHVTYLYDSVYRTCLERFSQGRDHDNAQRILILVSDGNDTGSLRSLSEAVGVAQRREIQIFAISLHPAGGVYEGDQTLMRLADSTGGQFFNAPSDRELPAIFAGMNQEMRTQYSISFQPTNQASGFHIVRIEAEGVERLHVRARLGYFVDAQY